MNSMDSHYWGAHASLFSKEVINNYQLINNIFMRKISTICMSLLMAVSLQVSAAGKTTLGQKFHKTPMMVAVPGMMDRSSFALQMQRNGFGMSPKNSLTTVASDADAPAANIADQDFGFVTGPNGYTWYYTTKSVFHANPDPASESKKEEFYTSSVLTFYNNDNEKVGSFTVTPPEGFDLCNSIQVDGPITTKLFNSDEYSNVVLIYFHNAKNGVTEEVTKAYDIETGKELFSTEGNGIILDLSEGWNSYKRLMVSRQNVVDDADQKAYAVIDVYALKGYGANAALTKEHTFKVEQELSESLEGSVLNVLTLNGQPYYFLSQYEKPFENKDIDQSKITGVGDLQTKDNHYILTVFDRYYNQVDQLSIPIESPNSGTVRSAGFGVLGFNDFSKNYFNEDDKFNYVIGINNYTPSDKGDKLSFAVYDSENGKIKDICSDVTNEEYGILQAIPGKEEQMYFLQSVNGTDQISMINFPSLETATVLPPSVDGNTVTTTLDRIPTSKNAQGYQYIVNLNQLEKNDQEEVTAPIAWINPDCTIDHKDVMNLGKNGETFMPLFNANTMNPYLFDTDEEMEYVYITKKRSKGKLYQVVCVAKADGTVIKEFASDEEKTLHACAVPKMNEKGKSQFVILFDNATTGNVEGEFYDLPFVKFAKGGDGTVANPYLVSTAGDLKQMSLLPRRNFKLANDIDMLEAGYWEPVSEFSGSLDGDNHSIYNLNINTTAGNAGLFGILSYGASVKNLNVINPILVVSGNNNTAGIIAGQSTTSKSMGAEGIVPFENIHVLGATITGDQASPKAGGIVGSAALYGKINGCSFEGTINLPDNSNMTGGIAGELLTSSSVESSSCNMTANVASTLGGIAGTISADAHVYNCESKGELTAENTIGGIVADSERGLIDKCISNATLTATQGSSWSGFATGGIVGKLLEDWPQQDYDDEESADNSETATPVETTPVVSNCVMTGKIYVVNPMSGDESDGDDDDYDDYARPNMKMVDGAIEYTSEAVDSINRVHMIVGSSIEDSYNEKDIEVGEDEYGDPIYETINLGRFTEYGLKNNYTTTNFNTNDKDNITDGKYIAAGNLNENFFTSAGYAYGKTNDAPWKGANVPTLYFNEEAKSISLSANDILVGLNNPKASFKVTVYGVENADDIADPVSSNTKVAEVSLGEINGNVATIEVTGKSQGIATITINYAGYTATCTVTVLKEVVDGIENVETNVFQVSMANGYIAAEGAKTIQVYSVGGQLVAKSNGAAISTAQLAKGIYVVNATSAAGQKSTAKFVVK